MQNGENITLQLKPNNLRELKKKLFDVKASKSKLTLNNFSSFKNLPIIKKENQTDFQAFVYN